MHMMNNFLKLEVKCMPKVGVFAAIFDEDEVYEETGYIVEANHLIAVYSSPSKDDLVLLFKVAIVGQDSWEPKAK
jgi:hypothetical protein